MPSKGSRTTSGPPEDSWQNWIIRQVVKLAAQWNEPMPEPRLYQYVENLSDLEQWRLAKAFAQAAKECDKFPSVAELRKLLPPKEEPKALPEGPHFEGDRQTSVKEILEKLAEVCKMPGTVADTKSRIPKRLVSAPLQLTKEQIEKRKPAEREEIERYRRRMEEGE